MKDIQCLFLTESIWKFSSMKSFSLAEYGSFQSILSYKINDPQEWWWFRQSVKLKPLWWWLPCDTNAKIFISKHDAESMTDHKTSCCDAIILDVVFYALKKENQISQNQVFIYILLDDF